MIRGHSDGTIRGYWKASSMLALQATVSQDLGITTVVSSGIKCKLKVFKKRKKAYSRGVLCSDQKSYQKG